MRLIGRRNFCLGLPLALAAGRAFAQTLLSIQIDSRSARLTQGGWARGVVSDPGARVTLNDQLVPVTGHGSFFIAFDRDAFAQSKLAAVNGNDPEADILLTISPRAWAIERVNTPLVPPGTPSAAFQQLRVGELAQITAARAKRTDASGWRQNFIQPTEGRISGQFGAQRIYQGVPADYHSGIDIAAPAEAPIRAPADGVVILAAEQAFTLEGHLLMLDHGLGLNSAFLHCSALLVKPGDHVRQGDIIGRVGQSGRATGPHLHWSLMWQGARLDPLLFLPKTN